MPLDDRMSAPARRGLRQVVASVSGAHLVAALLLVGAAGALIRDQQATLASEAQAVAQTRAVAIADQIGRTFDTWRTELLVAAADPTLQEWYRRPEDRRLLRSEVEQGLLTLHSVDRDLFDEVCLIDVNGQEQARQVLGEVTPTGELSPDESLNPFFTPTLALNAKAVHRNAPYVSPDSHRWVISNSTPLFVDDKLVGIVHFEANLDRLHLQVAAVRAPDQVVRVVDSERGLVITDSVSTRPLRDRPLVPSSQKQRPAGWQQASASVPSPPNDDLHWRVDVLVQPKELWSTGLWLRLSALVLLGVAGLTLLGLQSAIRRTEIVDDQK